MLTLERTKPQDTETAPRAKAPLYGVLGSKGGVGATTFAINLAGALALTNDSTATLIDGNLQQPDAAIMLAVEPHYTLIDLVTRAANLDQHMVDALSAEVPSSVARLRLMSAPIDGRGGVRIGLTEVANAVGTVRDYSDQCVMDLPRALDRHLVAALDSMTKIVLVAEAQLTAVASAKRWLSIFDELGYPRSKVCVVINRCGSKLKHLEGELISVFAGLDVFKVPNNFGLSQNCTLSGEVMVLKHPREAYSKAVNQIALHLNQSRQA